MKQNFRFFQYLKKDKKIKIFLSFTFFFLFLYIILIPSSDNTSFTIFSASLTVKMVKNLIIVLVLFSFTLSFLRLLYNYLEDNSDDSASSSFDKILMSIDLLSFDDKNALKSHIEEKLNTENIKNTDLYNKILKDFFKIELRLDKEIKSLNKKANMNLVIGITTTAISIIYLIFLSFQIPEITDFIGFAASYLPRLTLVIFIELFSFYFLNLYKYNLNQIKYYQDENTDISFKIITLKVSLLNEKIDIQEKVLLSFLDLQHNKFLSKDQSTVELEKYKTEAEANKNLYEKLLSLINIEKLNKEI